MESVVDTFGSVSLIASLLCAGFRLLYLIVDGYQRALRARLKYLNDVVFVVAVLVPDVG